MSRRERDGYSGAFVGRLGAVVLLLTVAAPHTAQAQQAPPPATPTPASCDVAPKAPAALIAQLATAPTGDGTPLSPQLVPQGRPTDAATMAAITAVVRKLEACINSGDQLRVYALFSDNLFRQPLNPDLIAALTAEIAELADATPTPIPAGERQVLLGPWHVEILQDGRVLAAVRFDYESAATTPGSTKAMFFVEQDGQWLIEEMADMLWVEGSAGPVAVEDIVGPPPNR